MNLPVCKCGHDKNHVEVHPKHSYSIMGWILLAYGSSIRPKKVTFVCSHCHTEFDSTEDPTELKNYI